MNKNSDLVYKYLQGKFGNIGSAVFDQVLSPDYKEHQPSVTRGVNEVKEFAVKLLGAFPDQRLDVEDEVEESEKIAVRYSWRAKHSGSFMNWPATNKEISTHGIIIAKVVNGKIVESWEEWDFAGFLQQIETH